MGVSGPGSEATRGPRKKPPEDEGPNVRWAIGPHVRVDLIGYSGVDITGAKFISQIYASGHRKGAMDGERLKSIVIGAQLGTRIILCASKDEACWEDWPWRAIRLLDGTTYRTGDGTPAVRVPDLEWLDKFDAKKANTDSQQSYPHAARLVDGKGWTFGRGGALKMKVRMIRVEHEDRPYTGDIEPPEGF